MSRRVWILASFLLVTFYAIPQVEAVDTLRIGNGTGLPGSTGNPVLVELINEGPRVGVLFKIDDLPDDLTLTGIASTPRTSDMYIDFSDTGGDARVILLSLSGQDAIAAGAGAIVELRFSVVDSIPSATEIVGLSPFDVQVADTANDPVEVDAIQGEFVIGDPTSLGNAPWKTSERLSLLTYPNPFNPSVSISFDIGALGAHVRLMIYNVAGQVVTTLADESRACGRYEIMWDGANTRGARVPSGVYFCRLEIDAEVETRAIVLMK